MSQDPRVIATIARAIEAYALNSCPPDQSQQYAQRIAALGTGEWTFAVVTESLPDPRDESGNTLLEREAVRVVSRADGSVRIDQMDPAKRRPYDLGQFCRDIQYFDNKNAHGTRWYA